jgi:hypothetical protein
MRTGTFCTSVDRPSGGLEQIRRPLKGILLFGLSTALALGCARRPAPNVCDDDRPNKIDRRKGSKISPGTRGSLVFEVRATENPRRPLPQSLITIRADSARTDGGISSASTRTDDNGIATFSDLQRGRYKFVARSISRHPVVDARANVRDGASDTIRLLLTSAPICENW